MTSDSDPARLLEAAIEAQERLRGLVDETVVDAALEALHAQLGLLSPDARVDRERRLVTVLFLDVVDSTRLLVGVDPEETMTIMDGALQVLAEPVRAAGGRVTRFMGDGFLAVFGLHRTREDDAEMAVRAALAIRERARDVGGEVAAEHGIRGLDVRVGVNTGLVVTGGINTVMGSTVNLASRIETSAAPGTVRVSQSTFRQLRGRFDTEPAGTIEAKGFPDPVPVHVVLAQRREGDGAAGTGESGPSFVGRASELTALAEAFAAVVASADVGAVTIVGNAGVGKSRLIDEFVASVADAPHAVVVFRVGTAEGRADVPHSLIRGLIDARVGIRAEDPPDVAREKLAGGLGPYLADDDARPAKVDLIARLLGYREASGDLPENPDRLRSRAAVHLAEFVRGVAGSTPILFVLDDVQWADDGSLAVLTDVLSELDRMPVLMVGAMRPEPRDPATMWAGLPGHRVINVGPLSEAASGQLLDELLVRVRDRPDDLRGRLLEHAAGNPYYLEELVLMCLDEGIIETDDDVWTVRSDRLAALRVPTTLAGVLRARLERLDPSERSVLHQASVLGSVFWVEAVARIADRRPGDLSPQVGSLLDRSMIERKEPSTFPAAEEYAFAHVLLRDTAYDEVLLDTRRRYHSAAADWLIEATAGRTHAFAGQIGEHLAQAGRADEAVGFLAEAADAAWWGYAVATADALYRRALELASEGDPRRFELLHGRVRTAGLLGDRSEQRSLLVALERMAEQSGDDVRQALAAIRRTFYCFHLAEYTEALRAAERACRFASATSDVGLQSRAMSSLAWAHLYLQDWAAARATGELALDVAMRSGDSRSRATSLNILGMAGVASGELSEAKLRTMEALDIARTADDVDAEMTYLSNLGVALMALGSYEAASDCFAETLERAVASGDRFLEGTASVNLAWAETALGEWADARRRASVGLELKRAQGQREAEAEALLWLGHALAGMGEFDEAERAYRDSAAIRAELGQTALGLEAEAGLLRVSLEREDLPAVRERMAPILEALDADPGLEGAWEPLRIPLSVVEALRAIGDDRAEAVLEQAMTSLAERSAMISDPADRDQYLRAVPWHRRLAELAEGGAET